jgi:hypothetical protein
LISGLAVGCVIYTVAVAPQVLAWLSDSQAARRRAPHLFRLYDAVARARPDGGTGHGGKSGRHWAPDAADAGQNVSAAATFTHPEPVRDSAARRL